MGLVVELAERGSWLADLQKHTRLGPVASCQSMTTWRQMLLCERGRTVQIVACRFWNWRDRRQVQPQLASR